VELRHIPHRIRSTTAAVDAAAIAKRPCFLCAANLPTEQRGVALNAEFSAYCNPFPIMEGHLTLIHDDHIPQAVAGRTGALLDFTASLTDWLAVYNGPECGASAPDHLHFQAVPRRIGAGPVFSIERDIDAHGGRSISDEVRRVFVARDRDRSRLIDRLDALIAILAALSGKKPEPMLNIAAFADAGDGWTVCVFPRSRHRPRVFETGELTVSPASVDLAGVFVVPDPADYEKMTGGDVAAILDEVTLPKDLFDAALRQWESKT
jgi:hypothetical protein